MFPPTNVSFHIYFSLETFENIAYFIYYVFIAILLIQHTICIYFTHTFFLRVTLSVLCSATVYYSLFFHRNRIILYSENVKPKYSLFISYFKPLFIIHYSASTPENYKLHDPTFWLSCINSLPSPAVQL